MTSHGAMKHVRLKKFLSAAFYAFSSFVITVVNKSVLTGHRFPSFLFLSVGQMTATVVILYVAKRRKALDFPDFDTSVFRKIFPLPLLYVGNHVTGLGGTKMLSLPMFTALRKFTILLTMILESRVLRKRFSTPLVCSVLTIVAGALVAASSDLSFSAEGYALVLLNDLMTASSGVFTKKQLETEGLGRYGVLFYNAFLIVVPTTAVSAFTGDLQRALGFAGWRSLTFLCSFLLSCVMGFVLMYSIVLCSGYNTALTTTVIGAIKNVAVMYVGVFVGGDYIFSWTNFIGLNICVCGGISYSIITFSGPSEPRPDTPDPRQEPAPALT